MNLRADNSSVKHFTLCAARNGPAPTTGWKFGSHSYDVSILRYASVLVCLQFRLALRSALCCVRHFIRIANRAISQPATTFTHNTLRRMFFVCFFFSGLNEGLLLILIVYVSLQIFQYAIFLFSEKSSLFNTS